VNKAVAEVEEAHRARANIKVPASLFVNAHPQVLTQVVLNLLSNAFKFHARGNTPAVEITAEERDGMVRVSVRDNGIGIAPQHQERIWNVFERLHDRDAYPGTGIGLAIVKRAVLRMQGKYGVESEVGKGSTFWIDLPKAQETESSGKAH
jgi:signal transduction histidine kinase